MDVSTSRISYDSLSPLHAPSVSLLAEWQRSSLFGRASGGVASYRGQGWSTQGRASLAGWLSPFGTLSSVRLELGAEAGGSHHSSGFDSGAASVAGRVHVVGGRAGAWGGVSLSRARNSYDSASVDVFSPGLGAWVQSAWLRGMLSYQHMRISGQSYPEADVSLTVTRGALDVSLYAGAREWPGDDGLGDELWGGAAAAWWVTSRAAITLSGGKYARDVVQGLPGASFVSVGIRLTPRRSRPIPLRAAAPIVYTSEDVRSGAIAFELGGASEVEIAGDWTGWEPVPMARDVSGRWVLPAELAPGTYRFNVRIDGQRWVVPDGFLTIDDGFGGTVGLLIVSGPDPGV